MTHFGAPSPTVGRPRSIRSSTPGGRESTSATMGRLWLVSCRTGRASWTKRCGAGLLSGVLEDYVQATPYFGAVVGRYGNRIAHGRFTLDGRTYPLVTNDKPGGAPCHLHGGAVGFDKVLWAVRPFARRTNVSAWCCTISAGTATKRVSRKSRTSPSPTPWTTAPCASGRLSGHDGQADSGQPDPALVLQSERGGAGGCPGAYPDDSWIPVAEVNAGMIPARWLVRMRHALDFTQPRTSGRHIDSRRQLLFAQRLRQYVHMDKTLRWWFWPRLWMNQKAVDGWRC